MDKERIATINRETRETQITLSLNLDGTGQTSISTGIAFFDHMLELLAFHGLIDLSVKAQGDLGVDYHHTVEDVGIVLGEAVAGAVGEKAGMVRYGFFLLPMDECLSRVVLDLGGRSHFVYRVHPPQMMVRDFNIVLVRECFQAFANSAGANLHMELLYGDEPHHIAESLFKGFGRALHAATRIDPDRHGSVSSTKGLL